MTNSYPTITVTGTIRLGQLLKLANLVEDGADARLLIQSGEVSVNGEIDTRRGRQLNNGDTVVVDAPQGPIGVVVTVRD